MAEGLTITDGKNFIFDDTTFTTAAEFSIKDAAGTTTHFSGYVLKA